MLEILEQVLMRLRKNPGRPVRARLDEMEVEIRMVKSQARSSRLGDHIASLGPWSGESAEEITELIAGARKDGGSVEPPVF